MSTATMARTATLTDEQIRRTCWRSWGSSLGWHPPRSGWRVNNGVVTLTGWADSQQAVGGRGGGPSGPRREGR
jgi:hypothetical protein